MEIEALMTVIDILKQCTIVDNGVIFPNIQLDRKVYMEINRLFSLSGGKWDKKTKSHVFEENPKTILEFLISGGTPKNTKKELQQFYTPEFLAKFICDNVFALTMKNYIDDAVSFIEPSAGHGAIAEQIISRMNSTSTLTLVEIDKNNISILKEKFGKNPNVRIIHDDFINYAENTTDRFDIAIMNPPFINSQDILHIHAVGNLVTNGTIGSISSVNWQYKKTSKYKIFKEWLGTVSAYNIEKVPAKSFKESGTTVPTQIIYIQT